MPLTPSQILSANRRILGGVGGTVPGLRRSVRATSDSDPVEDLLEKPDSPDPAPSILDQIKDGVVDVIEPVGSALDYGGAVIRSGALELGEALRPLRGAESTASFDDFRDNIKRRMSVGDILNENSATKDWNGSLKFGLGLAGDIAADPLNFVAPGAGAVAKTGLRRLGAVAGDDIADVARRSITEADSALARRFADDQAEAAVELARREANFAEAAAKRADTFDNEAVLRLGDPDAALVPPDISPVVRPSILDETAPTVRSLLGEGVSAKGLERTLAQIERRGAGGVGLNLGRFGGANGGLRIGSDTLAKIPGVGAIQGGIAARKAGAAGTEVRKAWTPMTASKDKFGQEIADILPTIGLRRKQLVDSAMIDVGKQIQKAMPPGIQQAELDTIRNALDVGGTVENARVLLEGDPAVELLDTLAAVRDRTYSKWIDMGKSPDELMSPDEYLRHQLTPESLAQFGTDPAKIRSGTTKSGRMKQRKVEGSIAEKNADDDLLSYLDDPVDLVKSSFAIANEVGGNAFAVDALEEFASKLHNFDVSSVVRHSPATGFREVAPGRWVDSTIAQDMFDISKSGTQSKTVRGWDAVNGIIKTQTLFNIVSFPPYVMQNVLTGIAMNAAKLGVGPKEYGRAVSQLKAMTRALKEGGEEGLDEALLRILPPDQAARALEIRQAGIYDAAHGFEDVSEIINPASKAAKIGRFGTKHTANANAHVEQLLRGAAFNRARDLGMSVDDASRIVRETHIDYSAFGRTKLERDKITRFMFFPTWLMRAPSAIVKTYAQNPGVFNAQARIEMGSRWYNRDRNEYGDIEGPRLSGPISFLTGLGFEAGDGPIEALNPLAGAIMDPGSVEKPSDLVPPLSNIGRAKGVLEGGELRSRYLRSVAGVRTGVDYQAVQAEDQFKQELEKRVETHRQRAEEGKRPLPEFADSQLLTMEAVEAGVEDPYSMNSGELARALKAKGYSKRDIERVIEAK